MRRMQLIGRVVGLVAATVMLTGCLELDVRHLASDAMNGRNNGTAGSTLAQESILNYLESWTEGPNPSGSGRDAYKQNFSDGTNLIGVIPGTDLADEYVLVGGHYDGLGNTCTGTGPTDSICNGATDNATGTAIVIDIMRLIAYSPTPPRRSIIFAFWDREEDGLLGANAFVQNPLIPLDDIVAYVNFDIQGANLRPSARSITFAVGAETGGPVLSDALDAAAASSPLDTRQLSLVFGQGRSDHAVLVNAGVPAVFLTDATGPCYHTVDDEVEVVDFDKLKAQSATARRLVVDLANRPDTPTFATGLPLATFADAVTIQSLLHTLLADLDTFSPADQTTILGHVATVDAVVAAGPAAFDDTAMISMLLAAQGVVNVLDNGACDGYLE